MLLGLLLVIPQDECTASAGGACVLPADPLPATVALGETADLRLGQVTVTKAAAGTRIEPVASTSGSDGDTALTTDYRFVLVDVTAEAGDRPRYLDARLLSGGRTYTRLDASIVPDDVEASPGFPAKLQVAFEVPPDALTAGLVLEANFSRATSDIARVDLGDVSGTGTLQITLKQGGS